MGSGYGGEKHITVWPYDGHEGGGIDDDALTLTTLREVLPPESYTVKTAAQQSRSVAF